MRLGKINQTSLLFLLSPFTIFAYKCPLRQIKICLGSSCYSRGNNVHLEVIKKYIAENHLEAEISFSGHLCEELCSSGPILRIDEKVYKEVNLSGLYKILQEEFPIK